MTRDQKRHAIQQVVDARINLDAQIDALDSLLDLIEEAAQ